jgi:transposase InsO family protein
MIISDRGSQFIARFWEQLHASLKTHLIHSSTYHPQTGGKTERVNQIPEDMLNSLITIVTLGTHLCYGTSGKLGLEFTLG